MCEFFSFITEPEYHGGQRFYFDWDGRKADLSLEADSHSIIAEHFGLNEDVCNKFEYSPLTGKFKVDQINSAVDDSLQVEEWVRKLDFKKVIEPLNVKPIVNPFNLPKVEQVTEEQVNWLMQWVSVWNSIGDLVWCSARNSVRNLVKDSVGDSVRVSVWDSAWYSVGNSGEASVRVSVRDSAWYSVGVSIEAYCTSFFDCKYAYDFTPCIKLWEAGLVPSFDGTIWRLHSGKNADVVFSHQKA